ncbi:MAG: GTPase ObgE [Paludibacteraceae bacterium]|nr:GTPase ObgE [Paludibacteraceae bacterium]
MPSSNFIDYVSIQCRSGKGGAGSAHLHRAKYVPKGGPDGGDGGRGGHVILRANKNLWTLIHLRYTRHLFAEDGQAGGESRSFGRDGRDQIVDVPCGTVAYDGDTGAYICELTEDGQQIVLLRGGRGGLGNWHFRTATNQAPRYAQPGEPRTERNIILQLKVLADVGLVGFPNAGKSTLLSVVSAARPEIADYPFTTLTPQLGIVSYHDGQSFCMADIPGIIEGAAEGRGLGLRFLRHIERNALLLFMIPADSADICHEYDVLLNELRQYNPELTEKNRILAITKSDMLDTEMMEQMRPQLPTDLPVIFISSVSGQGIAQLKDLLWSELHKDGYKKVVEISHVPIDVHHIERPKTDDEIEETDIEHTIYLNEQEEEWDLSKYEKYGWDTQHTEADASSADEGTAVSEEDYADTQSEPD